MKRGSTIWKKRTKLEQLPLTEMELMQEIENFKKKNPVQVLNWNLKSDKGK